MSKSIAPGQRKYIVLFGSFVLMFTYFGIMTNCTSVFVIPVCSDLGLSRSAFSSVQTAYCGALILSSSFSSKIFDRFGVLRTMRVSCVIIAAAYCLNAIAKSISLFYILGIVNGFCMGLNCVIPTSILLKQWFDKNVGLILGIASMGSGLGGALFNKISGNILQTRDWRYLYVLLGGIMLASGILSSFILLKEKNASAAISESTPVKKNAEIRLNGQNAPLLNKKKTVCIMLFLSCITYGNQCLTYTIVPYLQDLGFSLNYAATVTAIMMIIFAAGKMAFGFLVDKVGIRKTTIISFLSQTLGILGLIMLSKVGKIFLGFVFLAVCLGCPYNAVGSPLLPTFTEPPENRDKATGMYVAGANIGFGLCPMISGIVYDNFGSYLPMYSIVAVLIFAAMFGLLKCIGNKG